MTSFNGRSKKSFNPGFPQYFTLAATMIGMIASAALAEEKPKSFLEMKRKQKQDTQTSSLTTTAPQPTADAADAENDEDEETPPPPKPKKKKSRAKHRKAAANQAAKQALPPARPAIRESQNIPPVSESPQEEETRLTKNWGGARKGLSDLGIDLAVLYKNDLISNLSGGLKTGTSYLANIDIRASIDGEKLVGWKGGSIFLYALGDYGKHPNGEFVGSSQGVDNIETSSSLFKLYEAWAQQMVFDDKVSLLVGLHDLNSEFYVTDSSGLFLNPSFGIGPDLAQTAVNGPSIFPNTSLAVRFRAEPTKSFYIQWALFDGVSGSGEESKPQGTRFRLNGNDGQLVITEAAYLRGKEDQRDPAGKYAVGAWTYTATFPHLTATIPNAEDPESPTPLQTTSYGAYFMVDQTLASWVSFFARYGLANPRANQFSSALATGFSFTGIIPGRSNDRLGLAMTRANNGSEYKLSQQVASQPVFDAETILEATYRIEATRGIAIQPDFQYIIHPAGVPEAALPNAKVIGARVEISL